MTNHLEGRAIRRGGPLAALVAAATLISLSPLPVASSAIGLATAAATFQPGAFVPVPPDPPPPPPPPAPPGGPGGFVAPPEPPAPPAPPADVPGFDGSVAQHWCEPDNRDGAWRARWCDVHAAGQGPATWSQ